MTDRTPAAGRMAVGRVGCGVAEVALVLLVAHRLPLSGFGHYALVLAAADVVVVLARALVGGPLLGLATVPPDAAGAAMALALGLGAAAGAAVAAACAIAPDGSLLALAVLLPGLLLHDCLGHLACARRRAGLALVGDAVSAAGRLAATVVVLGTGDTDLPDLVLAWGIPTWLAATALVVPLGAVPRPDRVSAWVHAGRQTRGEFLGAAASTVARVPAALYLTGALAGAAAVGQLSLARALFGPPQLAAAEVAGVPGGRRPALAAGGLVALWTVGLGLAPDGVGRALAGPAWPGLAALVWIVGAGALVDADAPATSPRPCRTSAGPVALTVLVVTVLAGGSGACGAALGLLAGSVLAAGLRWAGHRAGHRAATPGRWVGEPDRPACHVISHGHPDPAAAQNLAALAEHLEVTLVTPRARPGPVPQHGTGGPPQPGYRTLRLARLPRTGQVYLLGSLRLGMTDRPDVVVIEYDPWLPAFWQGLLAARLFGRCPVCLSVTTGPLRPARGRVAAVRRHVARVGLRHVQVVTAASHLAARLYEREFGYPVGRIRVLPHQAVDTHAFRPTGVAPLADRFRIGYSGTIDQRSGVDTLLQAFTLVREQLPSAELHLMGQVSPELGDRIARLRLRGGLRVRPLLGGEQLAGFLQHIDVFVLPSPRHAGPEEHDGTALLRAMASGLACVGSDSGIIPELLFPDNGLLFAAGDHLGLAEELLRLAKDPDLRAKLGHNAREYAVRTASPRAVAAARATVVTELARVRSAPSR